MIERNSREFSTAQKTSSRPCCGVRGVLDDCEQPLRVRLRWACARGSGRRASSIDFGGFFFLASSSFLISAALLHLALDRVAVEHVQGLRERRLGLGFAGANGLARGAAERRQEVVAVAAVGNLHGPRAERQALELVVRAGHLADAVEQLSAGMRRTWRGRSCARRSRSIRSARVDR